MAQTTWAELGNSVNAGYYFAFGMAAGLLASNDFSGGAVFRYTLLGSIAFGISHAAAHWVARQLRRGVRP